ncbi:MAG: DUF4190 domain-containing protein [Sideroxydans sp.]|nr:DUF4190 domain-containing protein [Sideroxydans sp.]
MAMIFCRGCGKQIHETAPTCPHCGFTQLVASVPVQESPKTSIWMSITSLVIGVIVFLALSAIEFNESGGRYYLEESDKEALVGILVFGIAGLGFGVGSLITKSAGKGMAIAGIALSALAILAAIGILAS